MKDNSNGFIRGIIIFILVVFLILLVKNTRTREGLDTLNVGKWSVGGTTGQLDFATSETDKKVIFNAPLSVKSGSSNLNVGIASADKGFIKKDDAVITLDDSSKGIFIGSTDGTNGLRINNVGTIQIARKVGTTQYYWDMGISKDGPQNLNFAYNRSIDVNPVSYGMSSSVNGRPL
jgi:hypothetical protein